MLVSSLGLMNGCISIKEGFDSPAPSKRLDAIIAASDLEDDESLVKLVEELRSPSGAERMFAIRSLERRTGETLGYEHAGEEWARIEGFGRWIEYLESQGIAIDSIVGETGGSPIEPDTESNDSD